MSGIRKSFVALCIASIALLAFTGTAVAQDEDDAPAPEVIDDDGLDINLGLILGYQVDADDHGIDVLSVGVDARFNIPVADDLDVVANVPIQVNPTTLGDAIVLDTGLNFLGQFDLDGIAAYLGPGAALGVMLDPDTDVSFGLNVIGGVNLDVIDDVDAFVQGRFLRADISDGPNAILVELGGHFGL